MTTIYTLGLITRIIIRILKNNTKTNNMPQNIRPSELSSIGRKILDYFPRMKQHNGVHPDFRHAVLANGETREGMLSGEHDTETKTVIFRYNTNSEEYRILPLLNKFLPFKMLPEKEGNGQKQEGFKKEIELEGKKFVISGEPAGYTVDHDGKTKIFMGFFKLFPAYDLEKELGGVLVTSLGAKKSVGVRIIARHPQSHNTQDFKSVVRFLFSTEFVTGPPKQVAGKTSRMKGFFKAIPKLLGKIK